MQVTKQIAHCQRMFTAMGLELFRKQTLVHELVDASSLGFLTIPDEVVKESNQAHDEGYGQKQ